MILAGMREYVRNDFMLARIIKTGEREISTAPRRRISCVYAALLTSGLLYLLCVNKLQ